MFFGVGAGAALVVTAAAYLRSNLISQTSPAMEPQNGKALHVQGFPVADL